MTVFESLLTICCKQDCRGRKQKPKNKPITLLVSMYGEWLVLLLLLWPVSTPIPSSLWLLFRLGFYIFTRLEPFLNLRLWSHTVKTAACIKHFIIICRIVEIPAEAAVLGSLAFYNGPSKDGTRPGQFLVNTYQHDTRYKLKSLLQHQICCIFLPRSTTPLSSFLLIILIHVTALHTFTAISLHIVYRKSRQFATENSLIP